jgi:serine/threonine-protein kinase
MRSRRQPPVLTSAEDFLQTLRTSGLLPAETVDALAAGPAPFDARAWASELVERGLLTGYQAEQLLAGNAALRLGQYRLLDALAAGGMGRVYKAEHVLMRRVVALKVVGSAHDGDRLHAFLREIEAAARLSHPSIVAAYDAGEAHGLRFLVMEYVDGIDLDRLVRADGPLEPRRACEYARQAALALQYAFERGVLHRDVKPANLLAEEGTEPRSPGRVKVLDLGLALATRAGTDSDPSAANRLSGTPDFIAPEVAHDADSRDVRSDLYSLGCTLYYLLTGRVPFPGGTWTEKLLRHQFDAPTPLRELAPEVPPELASVVERLMAKAPAERYESPAAAAQALGEWLAQGDDPPAAVGPPRDDGAAPRAAPPQRGASPTQTMPPGPPSAWDLPAVTPLADLAPSRGRASLRWVPVVAAAVSLGLASAWWVRGRITAQETRTIPAQAIVPQIVVESSGARHPTLADAIAAAGDGDTITLHGETAFATDPLVIVGKALTVRAAPGSRPTLHLAGPPAAWQALISSDRALVLEGIELHETRGTEPAHLVRSTGAALRLVRCRLVAPGRTAPVVARGAGQVELHECQVVAGGLALCAEAVPGVPFALRLSGNRIEVRDPGAAAVSVWANGPAEPARLELESNDIRAARVLSLGELGAGVAVSASDNSLRFHDALLCLNGFGEAEGWRRAVTWHGRGNQYHGRGDWLCVDGKPAGASGLSAWQATWGNEADSRDLP